MILGRDGGGFSSLSGSGSGDGAAGVAGSLFTSEMLKLLQDSRDA